MRWCSSPCLGRARPLSLRRSNRTLPASSSSIPRCRCCRRRWRACSCRASIPRRWRPKRLGPEVRVVAAFHNVAAQKLAGGATIDCDVLVFGDDPKDREDGGRAGQSHGARGVHAGPLANSVAAEALTSVLIGINRSYKVDGAGIRITGIAGTRAGNTERAGTLRQRDLGQRACTLERLRAPIVTALAGLPEVAPGADLAGLLIAALEDNGLRPRQPRRPRRDPENRVQGRGALPRPGHRRAL